MGGIGRNGQNQVGSAELTRIGWDRVGPVGLTVLVFLFICNVTKIFTVKLII